MNKKILIVDDIAENIQLAANILTKEGYLVEFATNGLEALEWIDSEELDLVLLDVMMPDMDGYEVCQKVRENPKHKYLPIIFLSAATEKESTIKGLKLGAQDFVIKPFNSGELLTRIKNNIELSESRKQLQNMNLILEEKVKERTSELECAMIELKKAKEIAEHSSMLKSAFLANMTHEIRTPLNQILGYSQLIFSHDVSDEEKSDYMDSINKSSERLINLIENLIDISMIDTGQMIINNNIFNLNDLLNGIYYTYKPLTDIKGIVLDFYSGLKDEDSTFESDDKRIQQIIVNLIDNAIKFTDSGKIDFGYKTLDDEILFYVKDTGCGISEDTLPYIFDKFRQEELNLSRSYEGAGIGLSLVKGLIELLNGKIWVESEKGNGSSFFFTLNLKRIN